MGSLEELVEDPEVGMDKPLKNISTVQQYKYNYIYIYVFYNIYYTYNMFRMVAICYNFWTMDSEYCELRTPDGASKVDSRHTTGLVWFSPGSYASSKDVERHSSSEP